MKLTEPLTLIRLSYSFPSQTRKVSSEAAAQELEADRARLNATAKLYNGKAFAAIKTHRAAVKARLLSLAIQVPMGMDGVYIQPRRCLDKAEQILTEGKATDDQLIETFITEAYEQERTAARLELGKAYRDDDYPPAEQLRQQFGMSWSYMALDIPEDLPAEIRDRETARLQTQFDQIAQDCRSALREGLAKMVNHLADSLKPDADGRRKRLYATTVDNLRDFLNTIESRDITSDSAIRELAARARDVLGTVRADDLKDSSWTANKVRDGLEQVGQQIAALVRTEGVRKIDLFSDENAA